MSKQTKARTVIGAALAGGTVLTIICGGVLGGAGAALGVSVDWQTGLENVGITVSPGTASAIAHWIFTGIVVAANWIFAFALMYYWELLPWQHTASADTNGGLRDTCEQLRVEMPNAEQEKKKLQTVLSKRIESTGIVETEKQNDELQRHPEQVTSTKLRVYCKPTEGTATATASLSVFAYVETTARTVEDIELIVFDCDPPLDGIENRPHLRPFEGEGFPCVTVHRDRPQRFHFLRFPVNKDEMHLGTVSTNRTNIDIRPRAATQQFTLKAISKDVDSDLYTVVVTKDGNKISIQEK